MTSPLSPPPPVRTLPPRVYFALALVAFVFFVAWSRIAVPLNGRLHATDYAIAEYWHGWSAAHSHAWEMAVQLTDLGSIATLMILALMGSLWQMSKNQRTVALAWLGIVLGGAVLNGTVKQAFARDRPPEAWRDRAVLESNHSYPSGHSMGSAVGYGMLAYGLAIQQRRRSQRLVMGTFLAGLVLSIGFSRVYLRAHWFSDVVGGYALGLAWLGLGLGFLERYRRRPVPATAPPAAAPSP